MFVHHHRMIAANAHRLAPQDDAATAVRQGHGLLSGLLRCGHCGRKLHVRYGAKAARRRATYAGGILVPEANTVWAVVGQASRNRSASKCLRRAAR